MKPDCGKRVAVVNGGARDQARRRAASPRRESLLEARGVATQRAASRCTRACSQAWRVAERAKRPANRWPLPRSINSPAHSSLETEESKGEAQAGSWRWLVVRALVDSRESIDATLRPSRRHCQFASGPCQQLRHTPRLETRAKESSAIASV